MNKTKKYFAINQAIYIGINYFLDIQIKYVKIWLFRMGLNKVENGRNDPKPLHPPHIKHTLILNIGASY